MPVTIHDVAALAGVSPATVSRALRDRPHVATATRTRVLRAAELLDYVVDPSARSLAVGRTNAIGVVVPTIGRWAHARTLEVVTDVAAAGDVDVLPIVTTTAVARRIAVSSHPVRRRVDGFVLVEAPLPAVEVARLAAGRPVVSIGGFDDDGTLDDTADQVTSADAAGVASAVDHLVALGHRRVVLMEDAAGPTTDARRGAWARHMRRAGLVASDQDVVAAQPTATGGAAAMVLLLEAPDPASSILAASDEMALGAMEVARSRGLAVPDDLSVIGFDDQPLSQYIGLTTVRRDVARMARTATSWLLDRLESGDAEATSPRAIEVGTSLVVRSTTAARS